jgi:Ca2+-binding RTX toxin-like protein
MAIPKPNIATAAKTATTSAAVNADVLAAAAKQSPLINPNQVQNQGIDGSSQDNKPRPGFEGPSPNIPEVSKPAATLPSTAEEQQATLNNHLGLVSKADAMKQLAGVGTSSTPAQSAKDKLTDLSGSSTTNQPSSDQGFDSQPNVDANMVSGGKPMAAFQSASVGGPLGALAGEDVEAPPTRSGAAGSGMVSADSGDAGLAIGTFALAAKAALAAEALATTAGIALGSSTPLGLGLAAAAAIKATYEAANASAYQNADRVFNALESSEDPTNPANQAHLDLEKAKAENAKKTGGGAGMPNPENTGSNVSVITQTLVDQLNASKAGKPTSQGGSGDATPVDNGGIAQVVRNGSIEVNAASVQGQKLFGQPGGSAIGENMSGGNKGLNGFGRSNGAGAIDPGNEAGIPSGDPRFQQDPANALPGNKPAPTLQSPVGTQENQSSSVSTTLAAGARKLTLTGTAAINGTGNDLDNLINGNGAANELRGGAGNDILDGGSGRDQLTGGSGADRFRFATPGAFDTAQADRITDFSRSEGDRIELSRSAFGLAAGATLSFQAVNSDAELTRALGSSSLLIQDLRNGSILFNQNGTVAGAGQGGVFAMVNQGLILQAGDFALGA